MVCGQPQNATLAAAWKMRLRSRAEGDKLYTESDKLYTESAKLYAESDKLCAKGAKLSAEGDKLWDEAILNVHGNVRLEWKNWNEAHQSYECHLDNGEVYDFGD